MSLIWVWFDFIYCFSTLYKNIYHLCNWSESLKCLWF